MLCVNPNREQMPWPVVPVGLSLVATALEAAGHDLGWVYSALADAAIAESRA